jgi:hypothetical protein
MRQLIFPRLTSDREAGCSKTLRRTGRIFSLLALLGITCGSARAQYVGFAANPNPTNGAKGTVSVFTVATSTSGTLFGGGSSPFNQDNLVQTVNVGVDPVRIATLPPSPNFTGAYVTNAGDNSLWLVDLTVSQGVATVQETEITSSTNTLGLSQPGGIAVAQVQKGANINDVLAFIVNSNNTVSVVDTATQTLFATVSLGSTPGTSTGIPEAAATADGTLVFVANNSTANCNTTSPASPCPGLFVINAASLKKGSSTSVTSVSLFAPLTAFTPAQTTAASLSSNVATLTFGFNPSEEFPVGSTIQVTGFTGADTYLNGVFTVTATSTTSISYADTHANGTASPTGTVTVGLVPGTLGGVTTLQPTAVSSDTLVAIADGTPHTVNGITTGYVFVLDQTAGGPPIPVPISAGSLNSSGPVAVSAFTSGSANGLINLEVADLARNVWLLSDTFSDITSNGAQGVVISEDTLGGPSNGINIAVTPDSAFAYVTQLSTTVLGSGGGIQLMQNVTSDSDGTSNSICIAAIDCPGGVEPSSFASELSSTVSTNAIALSQLDPTSPPLVWFISPQSGGRALPTTPVRVHAPGNVLGEAIVGNGTALVTTTLSFGGSGASATNCTLFGGGATGPTCSNSSSGTTSIGGMTSFPASGVYTVTLVGTSGSGSSSATATVNVGGNCALETPTSVFVAQLFPASISCTAPANDVLSGLFGWGTTAISVANVAVTGKVGEANDSVILTFSQQSYTALPTTGNTFQVTANVSDTTDAGNAAAPIMAVSIQVNPPSCTLSASPNPVQAGRPVTVAISCSGAEPDSLNAAITNWDGANSTTGTVAMTNNNGAFSAQLSNVYSVAGTHTIVPSVSDTFNVAGTFPNPDSAANISVVAAGAVGCSLTGIPTAVKIGGLVTATMSCAAQTGDTISGQINWGDNSSTSIGAQSVNGTATLTFNHVYPNTSTAKFSLTATASDTTLQPALAATFPNTTFPIVITVAAPPSCTLSGPTSGQTGVNITVTISCSTVAGDSLSATINWGDNSSGTQVTGTANSSGSATLTATHAYATASTPTWSITATVQDSTTTLSGVVTTTSGPVTVLTTPIATITTPPIALAAGQSETVTLKFSGGAAEAGFTFNMGCSVSPTGPICSVAPTTLKLDASGNGSVQVMISTAGPGSSLSIPQSHDPQTPVYAYLLYLSTIGFVLLGIGYSRKRAPRGLAFLLIAVVLLLTTTACTSIQHSDVACSSCTAGGSYTVTVTATSVTPTLQASGVFTVVVAP